MANLVGIIVNDIVCSLEVKFVLQAEVCPLPYTPRRH